MGLFKRGDIVGSPVNYRESDGMKTGYHNAVVEGRGSGDFVRTRLITHSDEGTNRKLDNNKVSGMDIDNSSYLTEDRFNSVKKYCRKKGGKYDY